MTTGKTIALIRWTFVGKVMSLLFNMLQYFGHLMQRVDSLEKTLMLGGIGDRTGALSEMPPYFEDTQGLSSSYR